MEQLHLLRAWGNRYDPVGDLDWSFHNKPLPEEGADEDWLKYEWKMERRFFEIPEPEVVEIEKRAREVVRGGLAEAGIRGHFLTQEEYERIVKAAKDRIEDALTSFRSNFISIKQVYLTAEEIKMWVSTMIWPDKVPLWWESYG